MLKRSLVLTLIFLVTAHTVGAMDEAALVVVTPVPQKAAQQGLFAYLISFGPSSAKDNQDASTAKGSPALPGAPQTMHYMSPEEEARKKALEETRKQALEASSKLYFLYPGGPEAPKSPEPKESNRCSLKISFGSGGCCP